MIHLPSKMVSLPTILLFFILSAVTADQLLLVQSLFRHGDRTPTGTYPTDPYQESFWPVSWGQLTTLGMQQHFEQGTKLRDRYISQYQLFSPQYKDYNVYVRSTDVNRTLMSAYAHLAGFYEDSVNTYPTTTNSWPSRYTPVPVHTVEEENDHLLNSSPYCPRMSQIEEEREKVSSFVAFMQSQKPLLQLIAKNAGIKANDFSSYKSTSKVYASVRIEKFYNLTLPTWITDFLWEQFVNGKYMCDDYIYGNAGFGEPENAELIMLKGGLLLKTMISNMELILANQTKIKFFMYSAHDTTIDAFLRTLQAKQNILEYTTPEYAAVVLIELWKNDEGDPYIRARYVRNIASLPEPITHFIKGCGETDECLLEAFKERSQNFVPNDILKACEKA
jgi:lysosomal acid phosphatase